VILFRRTTTHATRQTYLTKGFVAWPSSSHSREFPVGGSPSSPHDADDIVTWLLALRGRGF